MTAIHPIAPLRDRLKAILESVSGIGPVYDYQRHVESEAELKTLLVSGSRLHFWCVTLAPDEKFVEQRGAGNMSKAHVYFAIRGYYALNDANASEKTFIDLVEDVLDALRAQRGQGVNPWINQGPARWVGPNHVSVANVVCHHAELIVPVFTALEC